MLNLQELKILAKYNKWRAVTSLAKAKDVKVFSKSIVSFDVSCKGCSGCGTGCDTGCTS